MSARVFTPTNQKLLTNVAIVRLKKAGKRFEIACFKNKVVSWRTGVEKDIDEVLQIHTVYNNVSKGQVAKTADLVKAFGTDDHEEACLQILAKGELQVSKGERDASIEGLFKEIATIVSTKCINPDTQRPYTTSQIEGAMRDIHFSVKPTQGAKSQALHVIRQLKETIAIERAQMSIKIMLPKKDAKRVKALVVPMLAEIEEEEWTPDLELTANIDPGIYRTLDETIQGETRGQGSLDILSVTNLHD
eukprot:m.43956 g.43956  ORF g.43956 m.43956 type:complete len:247 (+) comp10808_c0_seq3:326-1066(+)